MDLLQLRYFLTVAETLNITHAARIHMIPQPAMSKTVSKLEKELNIALFNRLKNRLTLTEEGKSFYQSVQNALRILDSAVEDAGKKNHPLSGELKILVRQHRLTVMECISEFKKKHPDVSFRIFYEQEKQEPTDFDLCISCDPPNESFDRNLCLITEKIKAVLSREHPLSQKKSIHFKHLRSEEFAMIYRNSNLWNQTVLHCQMAGFDPKITVICGDLHCLLAYVRTGLAVTLGPEVSWESLNRDGLVFLPTIPSVSRSTYLFWNGKHSGELSEQFRNFLSNHFKKVDQNFKKNPSQI